MRRALEMAGADPASIDLLIVATVTPDMAFPSTAAILADRLGMPDAAAYDLAAGCTGFVYAIAQAHGMIAAGLSRRALVVGGDVLSSILDWNDRSTLVLFGDGAGAVVLEPVDHGGFLGFELGADGAGGRHLWLPGSGTRHFEDPDRYVKMNGREVFKFATRVHGVVRGGDPRANAERRWTMSTSTSRTRRTSASSTTLPGSSTFPQEKIVVNVDRYGNTSSGSIPLALADAADDGRLEPGKLVLLTGMGAGLTWGSALIDWTHHTTGATA